MPFTEDEKKLIHRGINAVWSEIAHDLLEGDERRTIPKSEVIEVCLDADRLRLDGCPHGVDKQVWKDLMNRFYALPIKEMNKIASGFSEYKRFGL